MFKRKSKVLFLCLLFVFLCGALNSLYAYDKTYTTYMAGNAHIDTAWLWTTSVTINDYVYNTFNNAVNLMNSNSDYTFNASASVHHKWAKQYFPSLFNSIKTKVTNGQWALVGGQYLEPDLNMASGEGLVRQSLFGQRFFNAEFGKKCTVGWVPDVFGFSGQLPQILKKSGMDYFVTTKLNWNDTNAFPYEIFKWNGIDGSQVISYKPRLDYTCSASDRNNVIYTLDEPNRHSIKKGLVLYGAGDRGGGPTQSDINSIRSFDADGTMPAVKMYSGNKYFADLTTTDKNNITDVWDGEMYLENHRGTYTSQARIKKNNRLGEIAAEEAEKLSSMANWMGAAGYPQSDINNGWEKILKNHFHDILPGSGTNDNVTEAWLDGQAAIDMLNGPINAAMAGVASQADTSGSGVPIVVFNPLSFGRKQPVQTTVTFSSAPTSVKVYDNGVEIPSQVLSTNGNSATIVCMVDNIPAMGFKVVNAVHNTGNYGGSTGLTIGSNVIESDLFRVEISGTSGNITRIYDKANAREVLSGNGNVLQILDDTPAQWDAWNVDYDDMTRAPLSTLGSTTGISIVEQGQVKATYRVNKSYGTSTFSQYITLYPGINRIDIRMTANWNESHKMLKVAFPWNVSGATSATYEVAYGAVSRSNQRDTNFNKARFEVSAHKWADLSNGGYGVSLLNNCKYGYDTYLNTMRLSLLRSPKDPDANCDMGSYHDFTYSVFPHTGDWKSANTIYKGYELNYPVLTYPTTAHTGSRGKSYSFASVNQPNVILSVFKKAEDSNSYILRLYESQGVASTNVTVTLPGNITALNETNLLEENTASPGYSANTFSTTLGKYEIKTFKVSCGGSWPAAPVTSWNKCSGGTVTASGENPPNEGKDRAFDWNHSTKWLAFASTGWIQYDFAGTSSYAINKYTITSANDYPTRDPKSWTLRGSNNGSTWTTVDTRTNITFGSRFQKQTFSFSNSTAYQIYRLEVSANNGGAELQIGEIELFGSGTSATPTPGPSATPTPTPIQVSLSSYYNQDGFSYDTNRANGAYDPGAPTTSCYSADLLTSNPNYEGVPYTLGPKTDNSNNEIKGTGQTITLTQGQYSSIRFLGSATNGDQTGTFRINYTDSTYTDVSVTERDWCGSTSGQRVVQTMDHRHQGTADQFINTYVFAYYLTPTAGKTVSGLVIPNNGNIHVLAISLVY